MSYSTETIEFSVIVDVVEPPYEEDGSIRMCSQNDTFCITRAFPGGAKG